MNIKARRTFSIIAILVIVSFLFTSCFNSSNTTPISDDVSSVNSTKVNKKLSELLVYKIAKTYFVTCRNDINEGDEVPYNEIFNYYRYAALYTFDETSIDASMIKYYNIDDNKYHIPHEIADDYLSVIFNTKPNPEIIDCYDTDSRCYVFDEMMTEFYYKTDFNIKRINGRPGVYDITVSYVNDFGKNVMYVINYKIKMIEDGYKILSVKHLFNRSQDEDFYDVVDYNDIVHITDNEYRKPFVETYTTACQIAQAVLNGLPGEMNVDDYYITKVLLDEEKDTWIISFDNLISCEDITAKYNVAIQRSDGRVLHVWND